MGFQLHTTDGYENFTDDASYEFNDAGLLVVTTGEGNQRTYSPNAWTFIDEPAPEATSRIPRKVR